MAIKKISEFVSGTPSSDSKILFEQNGKGKSCSIGGAVNTCSLSYEEIMATNPVPDLSGKIASASALKHLSPVVNQIYLGNITVGTTLSYIPGASVTIPAHCIFGISAALHWGQSPPIFIMISNSNPDDGAPVSCASASRDDNFLPGSLSCTYSDYTNDEKTYNVWARTNPSSANAISISYWYIPC